MHNFVSFQAWQEVQFINSALKMRTYFSGMLLNVKMKHFWEFTLYMRCRQLGYVSVQVIDFQRLRIIFINHPAVFSIACTGVSALLISSERRGASPIAFKQIHSLIPEGFTSLICHIAFFLLTPMFLLLLL